VWVWVGTAREASLAWSWLLAGRRLRKDGKFRGSDGSGRACRARLWGLRVSVPGVRFCVLV
jgi:hypothetical protein